MALPPLDKQVSEFLNEKLSALETKLNADVLTIAGPIEFGLDIRVRDAIENVPLGNRRESLAVILDTGGGIVEVVERMVMTIRHHYPNNVSFIVPDRAMSAGTVFVMSGDRIYMNYFSVLGPIDPQVFRDGKFVPALAYLNQFKGLVEKERNQGSPLTNAEYALIAKLDLAELETFQAAKDLSRQLLKKWLTNYKFKDWTITQTNQTPVDLPMKEARSEAIAAILSDNIRWCSHSRGLDMGTLKSEEIRLQIDDYGADAELKMLIHGYYDVFVSYLGQKNIPSFVHSRYYL